MAWRNPMSARKREIRTPTARPARDTARAMAEQARHIGDTRGLDQWFADVTESWDGVRQTPERFIHLDEERSVVVTRFQGHGRGSRVEIDRTIASIWTVREGKVLSIESHATLEALDAAGSE